ncbi:MAG: hypothetical protein ACE5HP_12995 [Gemmatimonadota bacterium]
MSESAAGSPRWRFALGLVWSITTAWLLWVGATLFGFMQGFELGRSFGLVVGGDAGGSIGSNGVLAVSPLGNDVLGAAVFVVCFAAVVSLMQFLALLVMTDIRREIPAPRLRLVIGFIGLFALDLFVSMASFEVSFLSRPLVLGVVQALVIWLFWVYARRCVISLEVRDVRRAWKVGGWVLVATLAAAVYGALDQPWLGRGMCVRCGGVLSGGLGMQVGALTGIPLVWLVLRSRRSRAVEPSTVPARPEAPPP